MRIIAGQAKGRRLQAPSGWSTRPVTDRIREALFNIWQSYLLQASFLDLYSGSGSMGLEAMSRGASWTVMVEQAPEAVRCIRSNIEHCGLWGAAHEIYAENVFSVLPLLQKQGQKFDIIYIDPPFTVDRLFEQTMEALASGVLLTEEGMIVIRTRTGRYLKEQFGNLHKFRMKTYGESQVHFYERIEPETEEESK